MEYGSAIETRALFHLLKEQQGGHRPEELELGLGLRPGDDDMKMVDATARNYQLGSSSSVVLCTNTSEPSISHHPVPGLWFSLRQSINRKGEVLPQVPKAFIRVKDENVTVFMVKTYLVRKLGLSNEAEVEISCLGQNLMHNLTLKHVRDTIWLPGLVEFLKSKTDFIRSSQGASVNYLMSLHYGRTCLLNKDLSPVRSSFEL